MLAPPTWPFPGQSNDGILNLSIKDDGIGGVEFGKGSGLLGLRDRVEALGGATADCQPRWKRNLA